MGGIGNASDQPIQHKLDTSEEIMINETISLVRLAEVNSNCNKITIKENI